MISRLTILLLLLVNASFASIPRPVGWVSDFAGLLKPSDEQAITELVKAIKTSTGDEIAVVTQNSLDEFADPQEMALAYIEDWALGEKGKDNGLLILILFDPNSDLKQYRFETGLGLEGQLPDGLLGQIGREELVPRFRQGDFGGGIYASVARIGQVLGADLSALPEARKTPVGKNKGLGSIIFFILFFIILMSRGRRGGGLLGLFILGSMMGSGRRGGGGAAGGGAGGGW